MSKKKRWIVVPIISILIMVLFVDSPTTMREPQKTADTCTVYYLLNIDGMKGLGHSALLLTDEHGNGQVYSYNGMQYSLTECLMGKSGIGKMKVFDLDSGEVRELFNTGDLQVENTAECDNFDRMLYRYISKEQYEKIQECAQKYIDTGDVFEELYASVYVADEEQRLAAEEKLNDFLNQDLPRYQIYVDNCDTVARELIAAIDEEMEIYNTENPKLTPTGNFIGMSKEFGEMWGYQILGTDTLLERVIWR